MRDDIPEYSSATVQVQRSSFKRLHPDIPSDAILNDKDILHWMGNAPSLIVDYEGYLPNEDKKSYDKRRAMDEVYHGDIDNLVEHLRSIYTDRGELQGWALIFSVANDISSSDDVIAQATFRVMTGVTEEPKPEVKEVEEPKPEVKEVKEVEEEVSEISEPKADEVVPTPISSVKLTDEFIPNEVPLVAKSEPAPEPVAAGNVQSTTSDVSYKDTINSKVKMEESKMADSNNLKDAARAMAANSGAATNPSAPANFGTVQGEGITLKKGDKITVDKDQKLAVAQALQAEAAARQKVSKTVFIQKIVTTQLPAALRLRDPKDRTGVLTEANAAPDKIKEKIETKMEKFIFDVSGKTNLTFQQFEELPEDEKFANVSEGTIKNHDNITYKAVAAAMWATLKEVHQNNGKLFKGDVPEAENVSYPLKGFLANDKLYSLSDMERFISAESDGKIWTDDSIDATTGKPIDKPSVAELKWATKAIKNNNKQKAGAGALGGEAQYKPYVKIGMSNKKRFTKNPSRVVAAFTHYKEQVGYSNFNALISVAGVEVPASIKVKKLVADEFAEGKFKPVPITKKDRKGNIKETYAEKTVTLKVALKSNVTDMTKPDDNFCESDANGVYSSVATITRWGFQLRNNEKFGGNFEDSAIVEFFAKSVALGAGAFVGMKQDRADALLNPIKDLLAAQNAASEALNDIQSGSLD